MSKQELINIACKWLDYHNGDNSYITEVNDRKFINGSLQTDLRHFLENHMDDDYFETLELLINEYRKSLM